MTELRSSLHGLWLPLITPYRNGALDEASLRRLVRHYISLPIDGLILAATTGESLTLEPAETEHLVFAVRDEAQKLKNVPICLGRLPISRDYCFPSRARSSTGYGGPG